MVKYGSIHFFIKKYTEMNRSFSGDSSLYPFVNTPENM